MIEHNDHNSESNESEDFSNSIFFQRDILIATSHKKEDAIGPILQRKFQANIIVPKDFSTDVFGTFTGEIEREVNPFDAAKKNVLQHQKSIMPVLL